MAAARELAANRYAEAERLAAMGLEKALAEKDEVLAAKLYNNLGAARIYRRNYRGAFEALEQARRLAARHGQREIEAGIWSNLASLYGMLAGWPAAEEALARAAALMPPGSRYRPVLLAQRARIALQKNTDTKLAERIWMQAMEAACDAGDWQTQRHLWDDLSEYWLSAGRLEAAEAALANSFRLIALHRLRDPRSFWLLAAKLRLAQGRAEEALQCLRRASDGRKIQGATYAAVELAVVDVAAQFRTRGAGAALAACRRAWPEVARWRQSVLPDQETETAADVTLAELADQYVKAVFEALPAGAGASVEAWAAVEESRALGILRLRARNAANRAEPDQGAEAGRGGSGAVAAANGPQAQRWLDLVTDYGHGAAAGGPVFPTRLLAAVQSALGPQQTLFSIWLGRGRPTVWAVTRRSIHSAPLPPRAILMERIREFREEAQNGSFPPSSGWELYRAMFGGLPAEPLANPEWLISADDELLLAPLAALRTGGGRNGYLAETRTLSLLPSALWLFEAGGRAKPRGLLLVGDLVHNRADPRWPRENSQAWRWTDFLRKPQKGKPAGGSAFTELPTLAGSRSELETIGKLWARAGLETSALRGFEATAEALHQALQRGWTDIHFATHVLPAPGVQAYRALITGASEELARLLFPVGEPYLALSLRRDGGREGLSAADLAELPAIRGRVVLNGCATGAGAAQRGAGIRSFATGWLAAGASSVVASLWQVDDDGAFFEAYYRELLDGARPSAALQAAQTAMIRSGTWRAQPRYWAAYFHLGKD
ncbi:MAG: CHAT domain-containing protein [Bryobacteraceae bacterium]|nr:CHAT domain-containing protein [Bryobacteraceae bacterium]